MLRIKRVEIAGFRAFAEPRLIDLDYDIVVLVGGVGSGKTSVLNAIEYALFGNVYEIKARRGMRLDDLVNDFCDELRVRLVLTDEDGTEYEVLRQRRRGGRSRLSIRAKGRHYEGREAEELLAELLGGMDFEEFNSHVFIRREVLEALIYGPPARRSEAIDRLFGIAALEEGFRLMPIREVEEALEELRQRERKIMERIERYGTPEEVRQRIKELERKLREIDRESQRLQELYKMYEKEYEELKKLEEKYGSLAKEVIRLEALRDQLRRELEASPYVSETTLPRVLAHAERIREALAMRLAQFLLGELAQRLQELEITEDNLEQALKMFSEAVDELKRMRDEYEYDLMKLGSQANEARARCDRLRSQIYELRERIELLRKLKAEYDAIVERYGDRDKIRRELERLRGELEELDLREEYEVALARVLKETARRLAAKGELPCPVCERPLSREEHLGRIKAKLTKAREGSREAAERRPQIKRRMEELERALSRLGELEVEVLELEHLEQELKAREEEFKEEYSKYEELASSLEEAQSRLRLLDRFLSDITRELGMLEEEIEIARRRAQLERYEERLEELRAELMRAGYQPERLQEVWRRKEETRLKIERLKGERERLTAELEELREALRLMEEQGAGTREVKERMKRLERLRDQLREIKFAFRSVQSELRARMLERLTPILADTFRSLYPYKDYDSLRLEVEVRQTAEGYERSVYEILAHRTEDDSWIPVLSRMSDGQRMIVALSLIIALARLRARRRLGVLLLDEPVPNIDQACRRALIDTLSKGAGVRQLIIATQNPEYEEIVRQGVASGRIRGAIYRLRWQGRRGTYVEKIL